MRRRRLLFGLSGRLGIAEYLPLSLYNCLNLALALMIPLDVVFLVVLDALVHWVIVELDSISSALI